MINGLDFITFWSAVEGNGITTNIGYIDHATGNKKPAYYHYQMMADNFKGQVAASTTNLPNVKSFGSKNGEHIAVFILNEELAGTHNFTVRLNTTAVTGTPPLKINVNAGVNAEYSGSIGNQSSLLLVFDAQGVIRKTYEYSLTNHAMANLAPTETLYNATGVASNSEKGVFEIRNVYPNPATDKFTLVVNKGENVGTEEEVQVELINLLGQVVYSEKLAFLNGKEAIGLTPGIANGEYIIRVKEGEKDNFLVKKLIVLQ